MMNLREISISTNGLGGQLQAGVPLDQAIERMCLTQPDYEEFWRQAALQARAGRPLSECLPEIWPLQLVRAVQAGEQAGKLREVFARIQESVAVEESLRATLFKLAYPLGALGAGLLVSTLFLVFTIPGMTKSLTTRGRHSPILQFSNWFSDIVTQNWVVLTFGLAIGGAFLVSWLRSPAGKAAVLDTALSIPHIREALRDLYFGLWAYYMEMAVSAGIPTTQALTLTAPVLPEALRESVEVFNADMVNNNRPMSAAADVNQQEPGDPRREWWPFYIANAFVLAEQTGLVDQQLKQCAPVLINDGQRALTMIINIGYVIAIGVAAALILAPMAAYYIELFNAVRMMGR